MNQLTSAELKAITGGGMSLGLFSLIGAGIVFIIGVIDGYVRPLACHK